jgi:prophage antirepressor-like protein
MTDITPFDFDGIEVRTAQRDGEPWFVANDVATALGYTNPSKAVADHVDDEDRDSLTIREGTPGTPVRVVINESGLYALIFGSKMDAAKRFKRWVTSEVLPALRRSGSYGMPEPGSDADLDRVEAMIAAVRADRVRVAAIEQRQDAGDERMHVIESKLGEVLGAYGEYTALGYAKLKGLSTDRPFLIRLGQAAAAFMRTDGREPRRREDVSFGRINVYPVEYLDKGAHQIT